ncbi:imidazole glycerol phosphate synthase subunit HisH [Oligoflexia bacterium]|nr:imidazole glycerol phosphate synthase subunit HisH [Oligoflexia bacterium]
MSDSKVIIVDYGVGNLFNVERAFAACGATTIVSHNKADILNADRVVLPGVGAFGAAMQHLQQYDLIEALHTVVSAGKPLLAICVGAQVLLSHSEEFGSHAGLDIIEGKIVRFADDLDGKIPHIGWSALTPPKSGGWKSSCFDGLEDFEPHAYFNHSYTLVPSSPADCLAVTEYGQHKYCAAVNHANVLGCQFHLELSGAVGLKIIKNFLSKN